MNGKVNCKIWLWLVVMAFTLMKAQTAFGGVWVYGNVYEQDSITPIENATVTFSGVDVAGDTLVYQLFTDSLGFYSDSINEGLYSIWAAAVGYEDDYLLDSLYVEKTNGCLVLISIFMRSLSLCVMWQHDNSLMTWCVSVGRCTIPNCMRVLSRAISAVSTGTIRFPIFLGSSTPSMPMKACIA